MSSLEVLNKKKRIQAGHRGSVKRIILQAQELLEGERNDETWVITDGSLGQACDHHEA